MDLGCCVQGDLALCAEWGSRDRAWDGPEGLASHTLLHDRVSSGLCFINVLTKYDENIPSPWPLKEPHHQGGSGACL